MQNEESQYIALKVNIAKETIEKNKKSDLVDPNESNQIEIRDQIQQSLHAYKQNSRF